MRTRTVTTALTAALLLALTACSSQDNPKPPAPTTTAPALSTAQQRQACVDAIAATISARPTDFNPDTDSDPKPAACATIPEDDYLDVYMDGLALSNKQGRDALGG
jgi:hypothetical protein